MGKTNKSLNANRDAYLRMNFIYQAAHLALTMPGTRELVRGYVLYLRSMAKRQVLRLHPKVKRTFCKKCAMLLVPGITAKVRLKAKRQPHVVVTCEDCGTVKRFASNKDYKLWVEEPKAWVAMTTGSSNPAARGPAASADSGPSSTTSFVEKNKPDLMAVNRACDDNLSGGQLTHLDTAPAIPSENQICDTLSGSQLTSHSDMINNSLSSTNQAAEGMVCSSTLSLMEKSEIICDKRLPLPSNKIASSDKESALTDVAACLQENGCTSSDASMSCDTYNAVNLCSKVENSSEKETMEVELTQDLVGESAEQQLSQVNGLNTSPSS